MKIISDIMWWLCGVLGNAMTLTGLAGLLLFVGHGLVRVTDYIIDKEDMTHDAH